MSETPQSPARMIRASSAYLLLAMSFAAGLLFGFTLQEFNSPGTAARQTANQASQPGYAEVLAHALELEQAVKQNPNDPDLLIHLGNAYFDADKYLEAASAYERSLALAPNNPNVLTDLGTMYRAAGQYNKAVECYNKAIALDPQHQNARFNKGVVYLYDLQNIQEAIAAWQELLAVYPEALMPDRTPVSDKIKQLLNQKTP
jgi:cytochrome c-type biogenesis protein CcmH/NrfG